MEQSKRISVEQYLEMTLEDKLAYSETLLPEESEKFGDEVHKAMSAKRAAAMVDSLNRNGRETPIPNGLDTRAALKEASLHNLP